MSFWSNLFEKRWASNYFNHYNGLSRPQTALEPHIAALGEVYQAQCPFPGLQVIADFALPGRQLIIECDGKEHKRGKKKERDETKDAQLAKLGWLVVRLDNDEIMASPAKALQRALTLAAKRDE